MNQSRQNGILRLRHLREQTEAKAETMASMRPRFAKLARAESAPRSVSAFQLFQTPAPIAERMAALAVGERILEPSAGLGRIYTALRADLRADITLVEIDATLCGELYKLSEFDDRACLIQDDFLNCDIERIGTFSSVVMNSPFKMGSDIKHCKHALQFIETGGRLVALCYNGVRQNKILKPMATTWEVLPENSFKAEGTKASVVLLTIDI